MVETTNATPMDISELLEKVLEEAEMVDNIYDGENVIAQQPEVIQVLNHTLLDMQVIEESKVI